MRWPVLALAALALASPASSRTWYITPDGTGDAPTIHAAFGSAAFGDEVVLACGIYFEHGLQLPPGVTLRGETASPPCATIDGEHLGRILRCFSLDGSASILGVRFVNGDATGAGLDGIGGALLLEDAAPTIHDCSFDMNTANQGGGIGCVGALSTADIQRCVFRQNSGTALVGGHGELRDCVFTDNEGTWAGAIASFGGLITDTWFDANRCQVGYGGGAAYGHYVGMEFRRCLFIENYSAESGTESAGAYALWWGSARFESCTFYGNTGTGWGTSGPVIIATDGHTEIVNSVFSSNVDVNTPIVRCVHSDANGSSTTSCSVFHEESTVFCDQGGSDNRFEDPNFCDPSNGDFTLRSNSPCAPANSNGCGLIGALPVACGPVHVEEWSWGQIKGHYR